MSEIRPFDLGYVIATTIKHMRKSVDISIQKTFERLTEFPDNSDKSKEVFMTLGHLHRLRKNLDEFQASLNIEGK